MNQIEALEREIANLDNDSYLKLREWFIEFDSKAWDREIESDSNSGKLDFLINAALAEYEEGQTNDL